MISFSQPCENGISGHKVDLYYRFFKIINLGWKYKLFKSQLTLKLCLLGV